MADRMNFPNTVEEFMEQYKIIDIEEVYTNGAELVPIFRMKQWFDRHPYDADVVPVVRCQECKFWDKYKNYCYENRRVFLNYHYCAYGERKE